MQTVARVIVFLAACSLGQLYSVPSLLAQAESDDTWTIIHAGTLLVDARQKPKTKQSIVVKGDRVEAIENGFIKAKQAGLKASDQVTVIDLSESFVMSGIIDSHTHITSQSSPRILEQRVTQTDPYDALMGLNYAQKTLAAGVTTIRNVGSRGNALFALRDAIKAGVLAGPNIYGAGNTITPTGGHADVNGLRDDVFPEGSPGVCNGPVDCRRAVRAQIKRGADLIKITATGGVLSRIAAGTGQQFTDEELSAIVETAHMLGKKVAAHAHGADGIKAALRAGVDSIEHGTYIDDEAITLFNETGAFLVPTVLAGVTVVENAQDPNYYVAAVRSKALRVGPLMQDALGRAYKGGVRIAFGTDNGVGKHGTNARELLLMVGAGMSEQDTLISATVNAAELLDLESELGTLDPGKVADVIAVKDNPLQDMETMMSVQFVMAKGRVFKGL